MLCGCMLLSSRQIRCVFRDLDLHAHFLPLSSFPSLGVEKRDRKVDTEGARSEGEMRGKAEDKNVDGGVSQT